MIKYFCDIIALILILIGLIFAIGYHQYWLFISVAIGYTLSFIPVIIVRKKHR